MIDDHTRIDLVSPETSTDPLMSRFSGVALHGNTPFDMPFITEVSHNLWHGGVQSGLVLPDFIDHVVSVYPWEQYQSGRMLQSRVTVLMHDSTDQSLDMVDALAAWVNVCRETGPVLVHCQAGLNRSSLVVAKALLLSGEAVDGDDAVAQLRAARSPAVLCNPAFEAWVRHHGPEEAAA